jgi:nucleoside-diphosphate-sugar epimerase
MYLVTGGAGFIGSHIVERLVEEGEGVRVFDNFSTGKKENLKTIKNRFELFEGDLLDLSSLKQAMNGVDIVIHQAALRSVPLSVDNPLPTNDVNITGTLNVLVAASEARVKRVVYASSSSVYGDSPILPKQEDQPCRPMSPYAVSKLAAENYCVAFNKVYGLDTVSLRYFNVFGPRQDPESQYAAVIPKFITRAMRNEPLEVHGDGLQSRDFTYIDDVVNANLLAAKAGQLDERVFNIAQNRAHTLLDLIAVIEKHLGKKTTIVYASARAGDVRHTLADISRATRCLGYAPKTNFDNGIKATVKSLTRAL